MLKKSQEKWLYLLYLQNEYEFLRVGSNFSLFREY